MLLPNLPADEPKDHPNKAKLNFGGFQAFEVRTILMGWLLDSGRFAEFLNPLDSAGTKLFAVTSCWWHTPNY